MPAASAAQLEDQARGGDAEAFGRLLRLYDDELRGVVWSILRDRHAVDDAMQASYEKAFRAIGRFRGESALKTWLHSICYRTAVDLARFESRRTHPPVDPETAATTDPEPERILARLEAADALASLSPEQRGVLYLTSGLGYSFDETASMTGLNRGTVASRVSRAKERLRLEAIRER
ncbi:MAG: RNA polymerase sigma factor [Acidimicrobiales bacterium]